MNSSQWKGSSHTLGLRILLLSLVCGGLVALIAPTVQAQPGEPQTSPIEAAVITAITKLKGAPPAHGAFVDVKRGNATQPWAFGSIALLTPKQEAGARRPEQLPEGRLWLARQTTTGWEAAIDYTPRFDSWLQAAPLSVVSTEEKAILSSGSTTEPPDDLQLSLPWTAGQSWKFSGGAHGWNGRDNEPWSALDFAGGDGKVRAARGGLFYRPCGATTWVQLHHGQGVVTDYYHLKKIPRKLADGDKIPRGDYIGDTGTLVTCGGGAFGAHVHFNIRWQDNSGNTVHIAWDDGTRQRAIGGWTIHKGDQQYQGHAEKTNSDLTITTVKVGELLLNDGSCGGCGSDPFQ